MPNDKKAPPTAEQIAATSKMIDGLVKKALVALDEYTNKTQQQVDAIVKAMAIAGQLKHSKLAKMAIEETGRGVYEDKIIKNIFATEYVYNSIKNVKSVGVINENNHDGYIEYAEPLGVIAGVTPLTNPTSTTLFKALISQKSRNPIVFGFHPASQKCSVEAARIVYNAAIAAGAPKNCIQWIDQPSVEATRALMNHPGISLILATGGTSMVRSAYSAGKPALGVGPGNVPCYIESSAKLNRACTDLIMSKTFDNGMICASEQAVIVDKTISADFEYIMKDNACYFLNNDEILKLSKYAIQDKFVNPAIVGMSAHWIAKQAGINVPENTKILIAKLADVGYEYPLSIEKLSPILAYYISKDSEQAFEIANKMLVIGGLGHSAAIHSENQNLIRQFGEQMRVGRIIVNSPSSQGAIGDIYNTNLPSLTLGCGSYGQNSTTSNVSTVNLLNIKRLAKRRDNMQWFKVPPKIYFEHGSTEYLQHMHDITRAFIVTDKTMIDMGFVDTVMYHLKQRQNNVVCEVFHNVSPDPDITSIMEGANAMRNFKPDVIIAVGGGSPMDAAKGMWLFYEQPDISFENLRLKFLDIRKRTYSLPTLGKLAKLVCIPTTSGTGSEVTSFSVITDKETGIKYPLADYALTPTVAIIDSQYTQTLPQTQTADTGIDVLTHAIEAFVSVMANDYTDGLALQAIDIVMEYLPQAYADGANNMLAREKMHNASCIAGMAFTNSFLGLNHSMAHKLGGEFHITHGRANAIILPFIIEYNAQKPTKFPAFPKYTEYVADKKYAKIAKMLGVKGKTDAESVNNLVAKIRSLTASLNIPSTIKEYGVKEKDFIAKLEQLSYNAHEDQCTIANPRYPLVTEITDLYKKAYYGK